MDAIGYITTGSAGVAFLSMLVTIYFSSKAASASKESISNADRANIIAIGQTETSLREQIANARIRMEDCGLKIPEFLKGRDKANLSEEELPHLEFLEGNWRSSTENFLNAYEDAFGKYLDDKTNKERFRRTYINEIKNICDPKRTSYARLMHPESTSNFEAIWKVYKEWHRHEK
ncbi:hypothetical protein [Shewanella litoralis]|uniref:DUF4760 domain-containing protein n=1 Tax=Shewanella litoralis TaxID=2282700 RepID=A0ABQ2R8F8_9GAMM|nr:hypothetical protein [Shewanella litoralis]GGQ19060.1 hypothetical protein GCM10009411_19120 [Shewanella litoralis]